MSVSDSTLRRFGSQPRMTQTDTARHQERTPQNSLCQQPHPNKGTRYFYCRSHVQRCSIPIAQATGNASPALLSLASISSASTERSSCPARHALRCQAHTGPFAAVPSTASSTLMLRLQRPAARPVNVAFLVRKAARRFQRRGAPPHRGAFRRGRRLPKRRCRRFCRPVPEPVPDR